MQSASLELKNSIVRAGAGAGKTRGLVNKVEQLYRQSKESGTQVRIVVSTFTKKATQELKERLVLRACEIKDPGLLQFVTDPSHLQISTIHGLLNSFLSQVGHLAGLDAGFRIISESEGRAMARQALRDIVLDQTQGLKWIEDYGFVKTLSMCREYDRWHRELGQLEACSFELLQSHLQEKMAYWRREFIDLSTSIQDGVDDEKWTAFAGNLLSFLNQWSGKPSDLEQFPSKPRNSKKQEHLQAWHERAEEIISRFKKEMSQPGWDQDLWKIMVVSWSEFSALGSAFQARMRHLKFESGRLEMHDLELLSLELVREHPVLAQVFSQNWDYWMIDEFQDTSPLQIEALNALIGDRARYCVGDPQQSIYLFRGADVGVFTRAESDIVAGGGEYIQLKKNFRSEPDLLMWINDFMASLSSDFVPMEAREGRIAQEAETRNCVTMVRAKDELDEYQSIVRHIHQLRREGARLDEICVLARTHKTLINVSRELRASRLPTHVHAARGFSSRREVMDAMAIWKFLINPHDNENLVLLLRSPWFYVPDETLTRWLQGRPLSLWQSLQSKREEWTYGMADLENALGGSLHQGFERLLLSSGLIDLSLHNDPAGRKESNLWKLVVKARELERQAGASVLDLLESDSDVLESNEGDASSAQEPNCINLMTIHGSKGLEFNHVIIARMGESPQTSSTEKFYAQEETGFHFPVWEEESGEFIKSPLDIEMTQRQRARELKEFDRWLYVAVTRAKRSLMLTWSDIERESWASRSYWFQRAEGEISTPHYQYLIMAGAEQDLSGGEDIRLPVKTVRSRWNSEASQGSRIRSVTEVITEPDAPPVLEQQQLLRQWKRREQGSDLHRRLQALKFNPSVATQADDPAVHYVVTLEQPPMLELIRSGEVEWGFQIQTAIGVVEGQIDLWGSFGGKIYVIDYKSGSKEYSDRAFRQLSLYAWALRRFGHKEPIELVAVFPLATATESRPFTDELFTSWELEFGRPQT